MVLKVEENPFEETHSVYREKKWGKGDGSDIIDGYVFRGKHTFNKELDGLKNIMKKGVDNEIGGIKYKALDTRAQGNGLEIDVEMVESKNRGVGILKLYGPKEKKDSVVMVSKSKGSDSKFVIILAEKIIKPLMKKFICEETDSNKEVKIQEDNAMPIVEKDLINRCNICEKILSSPAGLKCHITKMHDKKQKKRKAAEEVKDVVENILNEVIVISDEEDTEEITLEEVVKVNFMAKDKQQLRRHRRDEHGVNTGSTSPPLKKKKRKSIENIEEPMVVDNEGENDDDKVEDLSFKLEEMDIDPSQTELEKD
jgi:hypothetical protein